MTISLSVGSDVIRSYKRLSYTPWHALAEFVDNSTQSYFNNRAELEKALAKKGEKLEVRIVYDRNNDLLRISDNAMGMDFDELQHALKLGKPPANRSGRSQYGLGMKTAACWFGDEWTVRTKKLGETEEHCVTVDVEAVASGNLDLPHTVVAGKAKELHGTIVEISKLHSKLHGRTLSKIKAFLKSMYRVDIRTGVLELFWEGSPLPWDIEYQFLRNAVGEPYYTEFAFDVNGKSVTGYVGVLGKGSSGRPNAGFSILRRGRVIRGHPDAWRPEEIFGQLQGSNDLINQRITGEINLDDFEVSHTKDDILWQGDEEDQVQKELRRITTDFMKVAEEPRKGRPDTRGPSEAEVQTAVDELKSELESTQFVDLIELENVPPPEVVEQVNAPMLEAAAREEPRFRVQLGDVITLQAFISSDESPNDPYFVTDVGSDSVIVVVNQRHPHWSQLAGSEGVLNYLRHCVYDAVSEWQCRRRSAPLQPSTIKLLKDALLRLPTTIEQGGMDDLAPESEAVVTS